MSKTRRVARRHRRWRQKEHKKKRLRILERIESQIAPRPSSWMTSITWTAELPRGETLVGVDMGPDGDTASVLSVKDGVCTLVPVEPGTVFLTMTVSDQ